MNVEENGEVEEKKDEKDKRRSVYEIVESEQGKIVEWYDF